MNTPTHPLNGPFAGRKRDGRQSFWKGPAALLRPLSATAQPLSRLIGYAGDELCPCAMGVFENELGGRVCVAGYYPWIFLQGGSALPPRVSFRRHRPAGDDSGEPCGPAVPDPPPGEPSQARGYRG
jgi:hypothetical protein